MAREVVSIDAAVYRTPEPAAVARLIDSHGVAAAAARWHWLGGRTLQAMAQSARAALGVVSTERSRKSRSYSDLDAAVCVEAAHVLGSLSRGERASGLTRANAGRGICAARGLTPPSISPEERGRASRIGQAANVGDPAAIAERHTRHAQERSVGAVLRAALALVPEQPVTGRFLLPSCDDALRAALVGLPAEAVNAVFPKLAQPDPVHPKETPVIEFRASHSRRRLPDENIIRCDHADGQPLLVLAAHYGVAPQTLYTRWRRYGLTGQGRLAGYVPASVATARAATVAETAGIETSAVSQPQTEPAPTSAALPEVGRLGLADLIFAAAFARETGMPKRMAIAWVRADIAEFEAGRSVRDYDPYYTELLANWEGQQQ